MPLLQTMGDISWVVHVDRFTWTYDFTRSGTVRWTDKGNGRNGKGTWKIERNKLITRWVGSVTWEEWDLPINTSAATGKCHMQQGAYDLRAETLNNYVELKTITFLSPDRFLEQCNLATGKLQTTGFRFSAWLSGIAIAYGKAYEAHNKVVDDVNATVKLVDDLLLSLALTFVTGAAGGGVGAAMKGMTKKDFLIDGIKDLAKFSVKTAGSAGVNKLVGVFGTTFTAAPMSPLQWQNSVNERVSQELAVVSQTIFEWRRAIREDGFDSAFDPLTEVENSLVMKQDQDQGLRLADLQPADKELLQKQFEKGWLVNWIPLAGFSDMYPGVREINLGKVEDYGRSLGIENIKEILRPYNWEGPKSLREKEFYGNRPSF